MKKFLIVLLVLTFLFSVALPVMAVKPTALPDNANAKAKANFEEMLVKQEEKGHIEPRDNGVEKYSFYLAGDVIDNPLYGLSDIPGSDVDSKLLVNQPNGEPVANVTGEMKGLLEGSYTAYISNGYVETVEQWNVVGEYTYDFIALGNSYPHTLTILTQENGLLTGVGSHNDGAVEEIVTGTIIGDVVTLNISYNGGTYEFDAALTIDEFGNLSGYSPQYMNPGDEIIFTSGMAMTEEVAVNATTWTGNLSATLEPIVFEVDAEGNGRFSFEIMPDDVEFIDGFVEFSIWVNDGATILISDTVQLTE